MMPGPAPGHRVLFAVDAASPLAGVKPGVVDNRSIIGNGHPQPLKAELQPVRNRIWVAIQTIGDPALRVAIQPET